MRCFQWHSTFTSNADRNNASSDTHLKTTNVGLSKVCWCAAARGSSTLCLSMPPSRGMPIKTSSWPWKQSSTSLPEGSLGTSAPLQVPPHSSPIWTSSPFRGGDVAQLVQHPTGMSPTQVRFPGAARDFSPRVNFQCSLSYGVCTSLCAITCIYI